MQIKVELRHETLGICSTEIASSEIDKRKIIDKWGKRYGKTMEKCSIVSKVISYSRTGKKGRAVINKKTGDIYPSANLASKDSNMSPETIRNHCIRESDSSFENKFRWAN